MEENNEKIVQNNVKEEVNSNINNQKKKNGKTVALIIIVLILMLSVGIGVGYVLSDKKIFNNTAENTTPTQENKQEQAQTSKKIDESKEWVYDAEYGKENEEKRIKPEYSNEIYSSVDNLKVPYININSEDAKKVNYELEKLYNNLYNDFGKQEVNKGGYTVTKCYEINYKSYNKNNILSVVITINSGVFNAGITQEYKTYSFNLETLKEADMFEVGQACGFENMKDLNKAIDSSLLKAKSDFIASENATRNDDIYFIDNNGNFNTMVSNISEMGLIELKVDRTIHNTEEDANINSETSQN